jgi:hypothetical protein
MQDASRLREMRRRAHEAGDADAARRLTERINAAESPVQVDAQARAEEFVQPFDQPFYENPVGALIDSGPMAALEAFNLSDEAKALAARGENFWRSTPLSPDGPRLDPDAVGQAERDRVAAARENRTGVQAVREIGGGSVIPLGAIGQGVRGVMAGGAVAGGLVGAGDGETIGERIRGAGQGALTGAVTAGVLDRAFKGGQAVFGALSRGIRNHFAGRDMTRAQRRAVNQLRRAFREDGISAEDAEAALRRYSELGFDDASLLDVGGDSVRRLVRGAANEPGPASQAAEQFLEDRIETRADRVADRIGRYISRNENFRSTVNQALRERAERAAPLYDQALGTADAPILVNREEFADLLDRVPRRILARIRQSEQVSGGRVGDLAADQISLRDLQAVKFGLDNVIETGARGNNPLSRRELSQYRELRDALIDRMPPAYREANEAYAGESALINALDMGRRALREDTEVLAEEVARLSASERDMFRIGIVRAVRERAGNVRDRNNMVDALVGNRNQRERLRQAFDSDETFNDFIDALRSETGRVQNARFVAASQGSQTAPRLMDSENLVEDILNLRFGAALGRASRDVARAVGGRGRQEANEQLVNMATAPVAQEGVESIVEAARAQYGDEAAEQVRRALAAAAPVAAIPAANAAVQY